MAEKKISNKDIFQGSLFQKTIKEAKTFIEVLNVLKGTMKAVATENKKYAKQVEVIGSKTQELIKLQKVEQDTIKLSKQKQEIEKEELKLQEKINVATNEEIENNKKSQTILINSVKIKKEQIDGDKKIIALKEQIAKVTSGEIDEEIKLRKELSKANKERNELIDSEENLLDAYQKESKRLNELRKTYKSLRIEQGKSTEETEKLRKEIEELDKVLKDVDASVGQSQRNVGNYPQATEKAKAGFSSLSGFMLGLFANSFNKSSENARFFATSLEKLSTVANIVVNQLQDYFNNKIIPTFVNFGLKINRVSAEVKLFFQELVPEALRSEEATNRIQELTKQINNLTDAINENQSRIDGAVNPFSTESIARTTEALQENFKAIDRIAKAESKLANLRFKNENELINLKTELLEISSEDNTTSFGQQRKNLKLLQIEQEKALAIKKEIADEELKIAIERFNINAREQGIAMRLDEDNARNLEWLNDFNIADQISLENKELIANAVSNLQTLENELAIQKATNSRTERENASDLFEQQLDFAIDAFDNQKAVNERIINSEKTSLKDKFRILAETEKLTESSYLNQLKLTKDYIAENLKLQGFSNKEIAEKLKKIDIDKLATMKDEAEIRKQLLDAQITDEIANTRILEIIRERKTFIQDIADLQEQVTQQAIEESQTRDEAEKNLLLQRKQIESEISSEQFDEAKEKFESIEKLDKDAYDKAIARLDDKKKAMLEELALQNAISLESVTNEDDKTAILEKEISDRNKILKEDLNERLELNKSYTEKAKAEEQKRAEDVTKILEFLEEKQKEQFDKRIESIDNEVEASKKRADEIRQIARDGIVDSSENLAFEQKKQAELQLEKEKEQKRQERRELGFTALKTYSAKVESGDKNPLMSTIKDITLLLSAINGLTGFIEGTERLGDDMNPTLNTGKDDYIIRADGDEKIFKPEHSKRIGYNISNEDVVKIVERFKKNEFKAEGGQNLILNNQYVMPDKMLRTFDKIHNELRMLPSRMPKNRVEYDKVENIVSTIIEERGKVTRNHRKQGGIWGR